MEPTHRIYKSVLLLYFFLSVAQQPKTGVGRHILRFIDHTQLDTHVTSRTPLNK
jgi:hypothetical protein